MDIFFFWIWIGGMLGTWQYKIGFWNRLMWPTFLGSLIVKELYKCKGFEE